MADRDGSARRPKPARRTCAPEERRRVLRALFPQVGDCWRFRFGFLLALSVVIAVMGLVANSSGVVIGAMLIAPLMTPVMAVAAAGALGWPRRLAVSAATVAVASAGSVMLSWLLASLLPAGDLTREVLSRTSPELTDLIVALAAGAAGAYATVREDLSAALPGVAVAVALVPPLATAGIVLEAGQSDFAVGALLLFTANLVAIALSGILVFLATGFAPPPRLTRATPRVVASLGVAMVSTMAVGFPLFQGSAVSVRKARTVQAVTNEVLAWLDDDGGLEVVGVSVDGARAQVHLVGSVPPPPAESLAVALVDQLGPGVEVELEWSQRSVSAAGRSTQAIAEASPGSEAVWGPIVREWLAGHDEFDVLAIDVDDGAVIVDIAGPPPPPLSIALADLAAERLGVSPSVVVRWTERYSFPAVPGQAGAGRPLSARLLAVVESWLSSRPGLDVVDVKIDGAVVTVDLAGERAPDDVASLVEAVQRDIGSASEVVVRFSELRRLSPETAPPSPPSPQ